MPTFNSPGFPGGKHWLYCCGERCCVLSHPNTTTSYNDYTWLLVCCCVECPGLQNNPAILLWHTAGRMMNMPNVSSAIRLRWLPFEVFIAGDCGDVPRGEPSWSANIWSPRRSILHSTPVCVPGHSLDISLCPCSPVRLMLTGLRCG